MNVVHLHPSNIEFNTRIYKSIKHHKVLGNNVYVLGLNKDSTSASTIKRKFGGIIVLQNINTSDSIFKFIAYYVKTIDLTFRIKPDVIHFRTWSMLLFWPFVILTGARCVYDIHELESQRSGYSVYKGIFIKFLEYVLLNTFSHIVVVNEYIGDYYARKFKRIDVLIARNFPEVQYVCSDSIEPKSYDLVYCGLMADNRGLEDFVTIVSELGLKGLLIGRGHQPYLNYLKHLVLSLNAEIVFMDYLEEETLINELKKCKVGWAFLSGNYGNSYKHALPNKLYHYLSANLPVVACADQVVISSIISEKGLGAVYDDFAGLSLRLNDLLSVYQDFNVKIERYLSKINLNTDWENYYKKLYQ